MKATTLIQRHFAELESRTSEALHDLQTQALARVLDYAAATVPFYRERIEAARSSLGADAGARDLLAALPVLTRCSPGGSCRRREMSCSPRSGVALTCSGS